LFHGVCDATMTRDEGWQFIQLGKYLERADKTLRILGKKSQLLHDLAEAAELPLANLHWAAVLRSCLAHEPYQRVYISRVDPAHVIEFLLLQPRFPRSVRFSLEQAAGALTQIEGSAADAGESEPGRALGRVLSELRYCDPARVRSHGLAPF